MIPVNKSRAKAWPEIIRTSAACWPLSVALVLFWFCPASVAYGEEVISESRVFQGHSEQVNSVSVAPDGTRLLSAAGRNSTESTDNTLRLWDVASGREIASLRGHSSMVMRAVLLPDGARILSCAGFKDGVFLWDVATGKVVRRFNQECKGVYDLAISNHGKYVAGACGDRNVRIWRVEDGRQMWSLAHPKTVTQVAVASDGSFLLSGSDDNMVRSWDLRTGKTTGSHTIPTSRYVCALAIAPRNDLALFGGTAASPCLWDTAQWKMVRWLGPTPKKLEVSPDGWIKLTHDAISSVAFSPDGSLAATGSQTGLIELWKTATGKKLAVFRGHKGDISDVCFSPDGHSIASCGEDKTVRLWNVPGG